MKILAWSLVLAACSAQGDDYPVQTGAAGPGASSGGGAGGNAAVQRGQVCIVDDPRVFDKCSTSSAVSPGGLMVTVDGQPAAMTDATGGFTLPSAVSSTATIGITGSGVVPTQTLVGNASATTGVSVPLVTAALFAQMLAANGITPSAGSGSILGSVVRGSSPATGITVSSTPSSAFGPLFDGTGTTPTSFSLDQTGARGIVWLPGVAAGPTNLTFNDVATSGATNVGGVQVIDGGITIVDTVLR